MTLRVLVIGADDFIGRRLIEVLNRSDWAESVAIGKASADQLATRLEGIDVVINCTVGAPDRIVVAALALATALKRTGSTARIVHLSSMTVYGEGSGHVAESAAIPRDRLSTYGAAQLAAEEILLPLRAVVLRPGCEYGAGCPAWGERVGRWLLAGRIGDLGAAGDGRCNLVYIDDLVAALIAAARAPDIEGQLFNIAMAVPPSWNDYFRAFAAALGIRLPVITRGRMRLETRLLAIPLKLLELLASALRLDIRHRLPAPIPPSLLPLCKQQMTLDVTKAESRLGVRWTSLEDGVRAAADVLRR